MKYDDWSLVTLADISVNNKGSYGIGASAIDFSKDNYTYLRITDINDDGTLNKGNLKSVDDKKAGQYLLEQNDIVFARTGNSTGRSYFYDGSQGELVYAGFLIKFSLDPKKVNPKFMRYYTISDEYWGWISSFASGSTRKNINAKTYANMKIQLPPRKQQDYLVNVLSSIDNKIELNNSIISNLEELAQTLFKRWFVDFEFPNENGEPYKSSGGEMVESELGMIPNNFEVKKTKDICDLRYGKSLTKKNRVPGEYMVYGSGGISGTHNNFLVEGPGLILGRKGSIGTLYLEPKNFFPIDTVFYIESGTFSLLYLYLLFSQFDFTKSNNDSAVPGLNRNAVYGKKIVIPTKSLYEQLMEIVNPIYITIFKKEKENKALAELRDTLLPKLLSGEIELPDESEVTENVPIS